jgi:iron complex outermembrane receptor protein
MLDGAASGSVAWYDLTQVNITQLTRNPLFDARGFRTVTGAARSQGLETEVQGEIATNLQLTANYAYTDSRILDDSTATIDPAGHSILTLGRKRRRLPGAPRHGASLWLTYGSSAGLSTGLKLGLGMVARSQREGDNANDYLLPGFTRLKALAAYRWLAFGARLNLQLNVDNLLDTHYFESVGETYSVMPGCPRRWLLSIGADL